MSEKKWWHTRAHTRTQTCTQVAGVGGLWQHIVGECWGIYLTGKLQRVCVRVRLLETEGGAGSVSQISHLALSFPSHSSVCILPLFNYLFLSSSFHLVLSSFLFTCRWFLFFASVHIFVRTIFPSLLAALFEPFHTIYIQPSNLQNKAGSKQVCSVNLKQWTPMKVFSFIWYTEGRKTAVTHTKHFSAV